MSYQLADAGAKVLIVENRAGVERCGAGVLTTVDLAVTPGRRGTPSSTDDSLALLIYTSGTTGRPKGVMLDHANLNAMCHGVIDAFQLTGDDHSLLILPLFHVNGIVVGTLSPLLAGGRATVGGPVQARDVLRPSIEQSRPTYFSAVPTIYTMLCGLPADVQPDTSSVRFAICGAAPGQRRTAGALRNALRHPDHRGVRAVGGHPAPARSTRCDGKRKPGTVGLAAAGADDPDRRRRGATR